MTDLSRCDGRVSNISRLLERAMMLRFFAPEYHDDLISTMDTQSNQRAITSTGFRYNTGTSRLSGSSETADFNSVLSAFIAYLGYRKLCYSPQEAWDSLGIFGGDDGLTSDLPHEPFSDAAASIGQLLEHDAAPRGARGVNFLARFYSPDVWTGCLDSMSDVQRQIIKVHLSGTFPPDVTPLIKLREKCRGYLLTDSNTPILGELANAVMSRSGPECHPASAQLASYWSHYPESNQFPNCNGSGWMTMR